MVVPTIIAIALFAPPFTWRLSIDKISIISVGNDHLFYLLSISKHRLRRKLPRYMPRMRGQLASDRKGTLKLVNNRGGKLNP